MEIEDTDFMEIEDTDNIRFVGILLEGEDIPEHNIIIDNEWKNITAIELMESLEELSKL